MKILLALFLVGYSLFGADLDAYAKKMGFERNYYTAVKTAKKLHRPVMLVLTKPECPWCDRFEERTLASEPIKKRLDKEIVTVLVYMDFDDDQYPSKKFTSSFSPRTFFINPYNNKVLLISNGYVPKGDFAGVLDKVQNKWKK
jgi:thioredoxin-related protein